MSRRLAAVLLALTMAATATPTLAHNVSYTTRETGGQECDFDQDVRTDIVAVGHHRHTKVDIQHVIFHTPTTSQETTRVNWGIFAMEWATANQLGYTYSFLSSGAVCLG